MIDEHPLPWLAPLLNGVEHANFFETRATEYSKGATRGDWNTVWTSFDSRKKAKSSEDAPRWQPRKRRRRHVRQGGACGGVTTEKHLPIRGGVGLEPGTANVCTPLTNAHLACPLLLA